MKKFSRLALLGIALTAALTAMVFIKGGTASAASPQATGTPPTHKGCGNNVTCVIDFGNAAIDLRLADLQKVIDRVNSRPGLTESQRDPIITSANFATSGLHSLRQKLDAETVVANARADVQSIYSQFRIFAVQIPSDYAQLWLDDQSNIHDIFVSKEPTIEQMIQKYGSPGNTQALYTDLLAQVNNAATSISNGQGLIASLIPANYPGTTQTLATLKGDLKSTRTDLDAARNDLKQIIAALKAAGATSVTPTPTA